jgi:hypothetical protein
MLSEISQAHKEKDHMINQPYMENRKGVPVEGVLMVEIRTVVY